MTAQLIELPRATLADTARVLRAIADEIERGEYGTIAGSVVVLEDKEGNIRTFGSGEAEYYRAFALLQLGIYNLTAKRGEHYML